MFSTAKVENFPFSFEPLLLLKSFQYNHRWLLLSNQITFTNGHKIVECTRFGKYILFKTLDKLLKSRNLLSWYKIKFIYGRYSGSILGEEL